MSVVVLGSGGHAGVLVEALRVRGISVLGMTDPSRTGKSLCGVAILGTDKTVLTMNQMEVDLVNGVGNRATASDPGLKLRSDLYERFASRAYRFPIIQHPSAVVASRAHIGDGVQIMAGAVVQAGTRISRNVIVNTRAVIEHDCQIGPHCHIAPGAILCGGVSVGAGCHIGAGAVILGGLTIGAGSVIAAGAVVTRDVLERGFVGRQGGGSLINDRH